ncbi:hypothetical protein [Flavihumibacter profundi]|uniref:hypothetical protein n=1 Tax=Flavihumibacter profundi TaxID=2716883 RepID=UPI001CC62196|nr:hypothetical protein [Flavihumibacter profundi]MBZ5856261.1 hypothetical protein [Flavihumibacter profundi]
MSTLEHPIKSTQEVSVWQLTAKLVVLAGVLMAYSYCLLLTIGSVLKLAHS